MSDLPAEQYSALQLWAEDAISEGWLPNNALAQLDQNTLAAPSQLFDSNSRPLVVGLFGGTGVGKSTLLNRFARETIAEASAQRPTSRDVTVYVHHAISVDKLPDNFPLRKMRTAEHSSEQYRHVMFIDMPDFDSVETANQNIVNAWLPHLDIVLYVLSPERYRDDQGWQRLNSHATEHAWIFVVNHWDKGSPEQLTDLRSLLATAGLADPVIFHTSSTAAPSTPGASELDQFDDLEKAVLAASDQSVISSLEQHGVIARLTALKANSDHWLKPLGTDDAFASLERHWLPHWEHHTSTLTSSLGYKIKRLAQQYADPHRSWMPWVGKSTKTQITALPRDELIDDAFLKRLDTGLTSFLNEQSQTNDIAINALKKQIDPLYMPARENVAVFISDAVQGSIALPGSAFQRLIHRGFGVLKVVLPIIVLTWIAWRTLSGFIEGGSNPAAYLGANFTINAGLLAILSWLIPTVIHIKCKPSPEKAAERGYRRGLTAAYTSLSTAVLKGLSSTQIRSGDLDKRYQALWTDVPSTDDGQIPTELQRMLVSHDEGE